MKSLLIASIVSLFVAYTLASDVTVLTPSNFYEVVNGDKNVLVEFYAPWCGHCKHLEPEYDIAATAFKSEKDVVIAKVDADEHKDIGGAFGVRGFPTLKFFAKGKSARDSQGEDYEGGRTADDIIEYMNKKANTRARVKKAASNVVTLTAANFDEIVMNSNADVLVEFYAPWCGHCKRLAPDYEKVANAFAGDKNVIIAKIDCDAEPSIATRFSVSGFPTLKFFGRNNKQEPELYEAGRDVPSFVDYINNKAQTQRTVDGTLKETAGRVAALDTLVGSSATVAQLESEVASLSGVDKTSGEIYVKLARAIEKKGADFVATETARVGRMLEGSLTPEKRDELTIRKNILKAFAK